jgi:hypothetical protein
MRWSGGVAEVGFERLVFEPVRGRERRCPQAWDQQNHAGRRESWGAQAHPGLIRLCAEK